MIRLKKTFLLISVGVGILILALTVWRTTMIKKHGYLVDQIQKSTAVYDTKGRLLRLTLSEDDKYRLWVPLNRISPLLNEAILLHEDKYFYKHFGVNPLSLVRAAYQTYIVRDRHIGGSTITMQLARLLYGVKSHTVSGKVIQIARAIELELLYSKHEILESYLNLIPFGGNIEGIGAASLIYFNKTADHLTLPEALTLSVIPQSPAQRAPLGQMNPDLTTARLALFEKWTRVRPETEDNHFLFNLPLVLHTTDHLPFAAPHHMVTILRGQTQPDVHTTLDLDLQHLLERHARSYIDRKKRLGITNTASMLVDYTTMEVKAVSGSVDFFSDAIQGQVNGTKAKRSPGSTLKPFIYALGMDQGVIHPLTVLKDTPVRFGPYNPENFDGRFLGPVTARDALIRSRNVPAISVAAKLADPSFYEFLKLSSISGMREESHYGLSLVLGGGEVTMEELVGLYAALGNRGVLKPLRFTKHDEREPGIRILSEEATYMVLDILKDNPRPDQVMTQDWTGNLPVYWKTGTSYGYRDAWAVGIFGKYVLAVWVGNFNGEGNPAFVGARAAAPLLFQMIDSIKAHEKDLFEPHKTFPANLIKVEVCSVSGQLPGPHCKHKKLSWFIPGKSPIQKCQIHREVVIDAKSGLQTCPPYNGEVRKAIFEYWPSDMLKVFKIAGMPHRVPPPPDEKCSLTTKSMKGSPPQIMSPIKGLVYSLRMNKMEHSTIPFQATVDADSREVYWFVDKTFSGKAKRGAAFFWKPRPGTFVVQAVDDRGRSDSRKISVVVVQ